MVSGIIIVNAYAQTKSELNQAKRLKEELDKLGVNVKILNNDKMQVYIKNGTFNNDLNNIDFCIYLDKDKYVMSMLEKLGIRLFNNAESIALCDDKFLTQIALTGNNVKMPLSVPGFLCYYPAAKIKPEMLDRLEQLFDYPIIVKNCFGSLGKGIYKCHDRASLAAVCEKVRMSPHMFQEFIKTSNGVDIRAIVIGGKFVGAMKRENSTDFRSNIELGGNGFKVELPKNYIDIAEKTAQILNLDYCGIDILIGENNEPLICEVNSNAFFGMFEQITQINVAKLYAEYIVGKIK